MIDDVIDQLIDAGWDCSDGKISGQWNLTFRDAVFNALEKAVLERWKEREIERLGDLERCGAV